MASWSGIEAEPVGRLVGLAHSANSACRDATMATRESGATVVGAGSLVANKARPLSAYVHFFERMRQPIEMIEFRLPFG